MYYFSDSDDAWLARWPRSGLQGDAERGEGREAAAVARRVEGAGRTAWLSSSALKHSFQSNTKKGLFLGQDLSTQF